MTKEEIQIFLINHPEPEIKTSWDSNRVALRQFLQTADDPKDFWQVSVLLHTMLAGNNYLEQDLSVCRRCPEVMDKIINKRECFGYFEFPNLVRQAAHLVNWMEFSDKHIRELSSITEIGGGFGAMQKVCSLLGNNNYYVIDLPEFILLQSIYLDKPMDHFWIDDNRPSNFGREDSLLISTWGLSEFPSAQRFPPKELDFGNYLFAYSPTWTLDTQHVDNIEYFYNLVSHYDRRWFEMEIPNLSNNRYLMGATNE